MRLALAFALLAALSANAHEFTAGALTIGHPVIYEGPPTQRTAAGYLTIRNDGVEPDSLIGVRADGPRATVHETRDAGGVVRMLPVEVLEVPAGTTVVFEPGGLHVMFMEIDGRALRAGATLPATLVFETAGEVPVTFNVEKRSEAGQDHHATH